MVDHVYSFVELGYILATLSKVSRQTRCKQARLEYHMIEEIHVIISSGSSATSHNG